jgi:hypothetical protein
MWLAYTSKDKEPYLINLSLAASININYSRNVVLIEGVPVKGADSQYTNVEPPLLSTVIHEIEFDSQEQCEDCMLKIKGRLRAGVGFFDLGDLKPIKTEQ